MGNFFLIEECNSELLALAPEIGKPGKIVLFNLKWYYLSREHEGDKKMFIKRIKRERPYDSAR